MAWDGWDGRGFTSSEYVSTSEGLQFPDKASLRCSVSTSTVKAEYMTRHEPRAARSGTICFVRPQLITFHLSGRGIRYPGNSGKLPIYSETVARCCSQHAAYCPRPCRDGEATGTAILPNNTYVCFSLNSQKVQGTQGRLQTTTESMPSYLHRYQT